MPPMGLPLIPPIPDPPPVRSDRTRGAGRSSSVSSAACFDSNDCVCRIGESKKSSSSGGSCTCAQRVTLVHHHTKIVVRLNPTRQCERIPDRHLFERRHRKPQTLRTHPPNEKAPIRSPTVAKTFKAFRECSRSCAQLKDQFLRAQKRDSCFHLIIVPDGLARSEGNLSATAGLATLRIHSNEGYSSTAATELSGRFSRKNQPGTNVSPCARVNFFRAN